MAKSKTKTLTYHLVSGHANSNTLFHSFTDISDSDITFAKNSPWSALNTLWELSKYKSHSMKAALFKGENNNNKTSQVTELISLS